MTGNEYQALAMRTNDGESTERLGYHTDPGLNEVKDFGVNDVLDGYTLDFHMIVPRGISIDEVVDMWSESWEEKVNESCTSWV